MVQQAIERARAQQIQRAFGGDASQSRTGFAARLELVLGIELPRSARSSVRNAVSGGGVGARGEDGLRVLPWAGAQLTAGTRL